MNKQMEKAIEEGIRVPSVLASLAGTLRGDLMYGPTYFDSEGSPCTYMDGVRQFDFVKGCKVVRRWLDRIDGPLYYEGWSGCLLVGPLTLEADDEYGYEEIYEIDRQTLATALFGSTLAGYLKD